LNDNLIEFCLLHGDSVKDRRQLIGLRCAAEQEGIFLCGQIHSLPSATYIRHIPPYLARSGVLSFEKKDAAVQYSYARCGPIGAIRDIRSRYEDSCINMSAWILDQRRGQLLMTGVGLKALREFSATVGDINYEIIRNTLREEEKKRSLLQEILGQ
jgi:hypothetical protein